jgi:hypothetical protein
VTTIPGKCHFDAHGWLQGPITITHYLSPNHYGSGFAVKSRGMVQHTEDGFTAGTVATFLSKASEVSAFFGVGENGAAQQFLPLGQGYVAWAEGAGNASWRSCECEDMTKTGQPMTAAQVATFAQILEAVSAYDGFPLQITDDTASGTGLITHGDGGVAWGNHPGCPGDVRKAQRPAIIALAKQIREGATVTDVTADGKTTLRALANAHGHAPSELLRATAKQDGAFPDEIAAWLNQELGAQVPPAGADFKLPL